MPPTTGDEHTILVTGGAKRVGRAICERFARENHAVVVHYNSSAEAAKRTVERLREEGAEAARVQADLADDEQRESLLGRAGDAIGRPITVLVNNASRFPEQRFEDAELADYEAMMDLHAWAPLELSRQLVESVDEGAIVNLLDTRVTSHDPDHVPYILSKQTLANLTEALARELAPDVRVNAVAPGAILAPEGEGPEHMAQLAEETPLGRTGEPGEVAQAVTYLVQAEFVTGQTVFVDGGRHLR